MYDKILTATDSPGQCDPVVRAAARIAMADRATLHILHVLESPYSGKYRQFVKHFETAEEIVSDSEYEKAVAQHLTETCASAMEPFNSFEVKVTEGFPWHEVLRWARSKQAGLIVLGPHSSRAAEKGVSRVSGTIGSTLEGVILHARCPVLVIGPSVSDSSLDFKRIMVAMDFSKSCESALRFATKVAETHESSLHLFHVVPVPGSPKYPQSELERQVNNAQKRLKDLVTELSGDHRCECTAWEGSSPHVEILKYARESGIDLIAMGSHTRENGEKWYVGSAVEQVSSRATCPVAIISDPNAAQRMEK